MKLLPLYSFLAGASYLIWWWSFLYLIPDQSMTGLIDHYSEMVKNPLWIPINSLQFIGMVSFILFYIDYSTISFKRNYANEFLRLVFVIAMVGFSGTAFYETILWPIIAESVPELLNLKNSPIYSNTFYLTFTGGIVLSFMLGGLNIGRYIWKDSKKVGFLFSSGIALFCLGFLSGPVRMIVQSIGITFWTVVLMYMGVSKKFLHYTRA